MTVDRTYTQAELTGAIHSAMAAMARGTPSLRTNALDADIRARMAAAISGGYDFADTIHNIYLDYGYPPTLGFAHFWNMYRRFGVATRVVELYPDYTWSDPPTVVASNRFTRDLDRLIDRLGLWRRLQGLDNRQRVGRYAGLLVRVRDGLQLSEPISDTLPGPEAIAALVPVYESELEVLSVQTTDSAADDYGMPTMYQYNSSAVGNRNELFAVSASIHPSRVIISAEGADNGSIYGIPALESVYNSLMDLRKVIGGGGEGFYKNSAQSVLFGLNDTASAVGLEGKLNDFNDQFDEWYRARHRRGLWMPGLTPQTLDSNLLQPKEFAEACLMDIAAGSDAPVSLLIGNQTGRLAGDQDTKGWLTRVQSRRENHGTGTVRDVLDWFIRWGALPREQYDVEWADAMAPSQDERLANAERMADTNLKMFQAGMGPAYTEDEIREAGGFEEPIAEPAVTGEDIPDER